MARTFDARELEARVEALLLRFQRSRALTPIVSTDGVTMHRARRTVAVYSPKGGVGTTTIATNIAIAAVARRPDRVVLVDLALQFGGVATLLNLDPKQTLADVVRDEASLREPELLRTYAMRHDSGLHVLAAPAAPEAAETVTPAHVTQILRTLLEGYDMVVVDAGSTLDERALAIFEAAEQVILPITPEIGALKAMHALIEYLGEAGSVGLKSMFVLNDIFAREILKARDVETFLGSKIAVELPYDPFLYLKAVNEGVPIVTGAPRSVPAERLARLGSMAFAEEASTLQAAAEEKRSGACSGDAARAGRWRVAPRPRAIGSPPPAARDRARRRGSRGPRSGGGRARSGAADGCPGASRGSRWPAGSRSHVGPRTACGR